MDSLKRSGINPIINTLLSASTRLIEISGANRERTLLEISSRSKALFYSSYLRTLLTFSPNTSRFI